MAFSVVRRSGITDIGTSRVWRCDIPQVTCERISVTAKCYQSPLHIPLPTLANLHMRHAPPQPRVVDGGAENELRHGRTVIVRARRDSKTVALAVIASCSKAVPDLISACQNDCVLLTRVTQMDCWPKLLTSRLEALAVAASEARPRAMVFEKNMVDVQAVRDSG